MRCLVSLIPFFFVYRSLLRIPDCIDVLKELNAAALDSCDSHGRALYMCCCFDLILEAGEAKTNKQTNKTATPTTVKLFSYKNWARVFIRYKVIKR